MASIASLDINLNANSAGLRRGLDRARRDTRRFSQQIQRNLGTVRRGFAVAAGAAVALGAATATVTRAAASFEDLRTSLTSVTGSVRGGLDAFDFISSFATRTQFSVEQLGAAFITLQASGIEPTEQLLTRFTDVAAVTTDQLGSLQAITALYSRTTSGGLGLEELNRLADRGIPVFRILQEQLGLTRLEISDVGKTAEGAAMILRALETGLDEAFGGATAARAMNLSTIISNTGIAFTLFAASVGEQAAPAVRRLLEVLTEAANGGNNAAVTFGRILSGAVNFATNAFIFLSNHATGLIRTFQIFTTVVTFLAVNALGAALAGAISGTGRAIAILLPLIRAATLAQVTFATASAAVVGVLTGGLALAAAAAAFIAFNVAVRSAVKETVELGNEVGATQVEIAGLTQSLEELEDLGPIEPLVVPPPEEISNLIMELDEGFNSVGESIQTNLRDSLQEAFRTGELSARSFFDGITNQILNVAANALTNNILGAIFGSGTGANAFGSFLGFQSGGVVPNTPGSTPGRDSVPALLTPGEVIIPTTGAGEGISVNFNITGDISRQTIATIQGQAEVVADIVASSFRERGIA